MKLECSTRKNLRGYLRPQQGLAVLAWAVLLACGMVASALPAQQPQEMFRAAKKNMQHHTWKVSVLVQGEHGMKVAGLIHDDDFDLTVKMEGGESRQIAIGEKAWMTLDHGKTWKSYPSPDRRFYNLTHAPINFVPGEKIPPFEIIPNDKEGGADVVRVRLIDPSAESYVGDRPNAWISLKDGKPDVITHSVGPLVFANDYVPGDVRYSPAEEQKILPPPGNSAAVPSDSGAQDLLAAAWKNMEQGLWEVDAMVEITKKTHLHGLLSGADFDLVSDPQEGGNGTHGIGLHGTVYGSLDKGKTWKIEPPDDIAPYNWVHSPILYKAIGPPFEEVGREEHDGETWLHVQLKVQDKASKPDSLPNYWIALDKDGKPGAVRRYLGTIISYRQGTHIIQCDISYRPADAKAAITAPPRERITNLPTGTDSDTFTKALTYSNAVFAKNHLIVYATMEWSDSGEKHNYRYDRYPDVERLTEGNETFARKAGGTWLKSEDWAKTGKKVSGKTSAELDGMVSTVDAALHKNLTPPDRERSVAEIKERIPKEDYEWVVFETRKEKTVTFQHPQFVFSVRGHKDEEGVFIGYRGIQMSGERQLTATLKFDLMILAGNEGNAPSTVPGKTPTSPVVNQLDISTVITKADAESILGVPVRAPKGRNTFTKENDFYDSGWTYTSADGNRTLMLDLLFGQPKLAGTMFSALPTDGGPAEKIEGLGDKAIFYHDKTGLDMLNVLKGNVLLTIGTTGIPAKSSLENEKAGAKKVLARLAELPAAPATAAGGTPPAPPAPQKLPAPEKGKVYGFKDLMLQSKALMGKVVPVMIKPKQVTRKTDLHNGWFVVSLTDADPAFSTFGLVDITKEGLEKLGLEDGSATKNQTIFIHLKKEKLSGQARFQAVGTHFEKSGEEGGVYSW